MFTVASLRTIDELEMASACRRGHFHHSVSRTRNITGCRHKLRSKMRQGTALRHRLRHHATHTQIGEVTSLETVVAKARGLLAQERNHLWKHPSRRIC